MAIVRSTAPRRPSRAWIAVLAVLLLFIGGAVTVVLLSPRWLVPMAEEEIVERLRRRLDTTVEVEDIEISWGTVALTNVQIGGGDGEPTIALARVVVGVEESSLWEGRAVVDSVTVTGGRVQGQRAELETFARRLLQRGPKDPEAGEGRVKLVPEVMSIQGVWIVVTEPAGDVRDRRVEAQVTAQLEVATKTADIAAHNVRIDPGHGPLVTASSIATRVQAQRTEEGMSVAFPVRLEMRGVGAAVTDKIAVAGTDGSVVIADRDLSEVEIDIEGTFAGDASEARSDADKLWSAAGRVKRDLSAGELRLDMEAFELGRAREVLERLPVVDSEHATVGGHIAIIFGHGVARVEGDVSLEGLNVDHPLLARTVVRDVGFDLSFAAEVDPIARQARIHYADIERRGVRLTVEGTFDHPTRSEGRHYAMRARMPKVPCQNVLDAIPAELVPSLVDFELDGEFEADVVFDADYADLDALALDGNVGIWNCTVTSAPEYADAQRLTSGFSHRVLMRDGRTRTVEMYPGSRTFTPVHRISPYVIAAIQSTEDGGFWRHRGFMPSQFRVALRRNLGAGKVRLGASTITMQMVKNVLLSHERTLARKLQELFLTWYVETVLTKDRIMELYLNGIEYGPGLYGITEAARVYFGKHPADLTPPEAVFIALMLPSPVRRHAQYCRGELTESFQSKVTFILGVMNQRGRLSDLEYEVWKEEPVVFDLRRRGSDAACYGAIKRVQDGTYTQRALSGLLAGDEHAFDEAEEPEGEVAGEEEYPVYDGDDPAEVDAPGRPAMEDEPVDDDGATGDVAPEG
jgi:hypothetical protein